MCQGVELWQPHLHRVSVTLCVSVAMLRGLTARNTQGRSTTTASSDLRGSFAAIRVAREQQNMTRAQLSRQFGVSMRSVSRALSGNDSVGGKRGRSTYLDTFSENVLVAGVVENQAMNNPMTLAEICSQARVLKEDRLYSVAHLRMLCRPPSEGWARGFLERHHLSLRICEGLESSRATAEVLDRGMRDFFAQLRTATEDMTDDDLRCSLYNMDESGFNVAFAREGQKVVAVRGTRTVSSVTGMSRDTTSIVCCGNAVGEFARPLVIYKGAERSPSHTAAVHDLAKRMDPQDRVFYEEFSRVAFVTAQKEGYMDEEKFALWVEHCFLPCIGTKRPVVLVMDNSSTHQNEATLARLAAENIRVVWLPPHSSHLVQPLDVSFFSPMKKAYKAALRRLQDMVGVNVSSYQKLIPIAVAYTTAVRSAYLIRGFIRTGIYPFVPRTVGELSSGKLGIPKVPEVDQLTRRERAALISRFAENLEMRRTAKRSGAQGPRGRQPGAVSMRATAVSVSSLVQQGIDVPSRNGKRQSASASRSSRKRVCTQPGPKA